MKQQSSLLLDIHNALFHHFGARNWWPADTPFEVAIGAILTQNTSWKNVEYAINNLKDNSSLTPQRIAAMPIDQLEKLIRPSGYFRQKAMRLQGFSRFLVARFRGEIVWLCSGTLDEARTRLLALKGIGPETADSILLYAAGKPSFVVDAYTRRIFQRVGLLDGSENYNEVRTSFMQQLPEDVQLYNEYHAQIVCLAKTYCRKNPLCLNCPINRLCKHANKKDIADNA